MTRFRVLHFSPCLSAARPEDAGGLPLTMLTATLRNGNGAPELMVISAMPGPLRQAPRALDWEGRGSRFPGGKFSVRDTGIYAKVGGI